MNDVVLTKIYNAPPVRTDEILRYSGCGRADGATMDLLRSCVDEAQEILQYKVCFIELPAAVSDGVCDFGSFRLRSANLAKCLSGCRRALLFAATVGPRIDRLIAKYGRIAPARALLLQALGAERVESLCDLFCGDYGAENHAELTPRFSPGYGDLSLGTQRDVFRVLDCPKKIGVTLGENLLMSPSKSVTAFAGIR